MILLPLSCKELSGVSCSLMGEGKEDTVELKDPLHRSYDDADAGGDRICSWEDVAW